MDRELNHLWEDERFLNCDKEVNYEGHNRKEGMRMSSQFNERPPSQLNVMMNGLWSVD